MWLLAAIGGVLAVATTLLPWHDAVDTTQRVAPILTFLVAITVLAHLSDAAELFDILAHRAARLSGCSTLRLFLAICALATLTTITLSLDTTAVLLTPVVLAMTRGAQLDPRPFAFATVWLANAASLLLPVSNLTNLLAADRLGDLGTSEFAARMALPELAAVIVVVGMAFSLFRSSLRGPHEPVPRIEVRDRALLWLAALCCASVAPASLLGLAPWKVALPAAAVLLLGTAIRKRTVDLRGAVPWRIVLLVEGLFLIAAAAGRHGLDDALRHLTGHHSFVTQVAGAGIGNLANNLPSYVTIERAVPPGHTQELLALLIGTNAGTMLLISGSLATLLWRDRCRAAGLHISAREFMRYGLAVVPPLMGLTYCALIVGA